MSLFDPASRLARGAGALLALAVATGCAAHYAKYPRSPSTAFQEYHATTLGRLFEPAAAKHPGESGVLYMRYGRRALEAHMTRGASRSPAWFNEALALKKKVETDHGDLANVLKAYDDLLFDMTELNNDPTNWWGPNRQCMEALLKLVGFKRIVYRPHPIVGGARGIFHAYKES